MVCGWVGGGGGNDKEDEGRGLKEEGEEEKEEEKEKEEEQEQEQGEAGRNRTENEDEETGEKPPMAGQTTHLKLRIGMSRLALPAGVRAAHPSSTKESEATVSKTSPLTFGFVVLLTLPSVPSNPQPRQRRSEGKDEQARLRFDFSRVGAFLGPSGTAVEGPEQASGAPREVSKGEPRGVKTKSRERVFA